MKRMTINRDKSPSAEGHIKQLTPQADPPAAHYAHRIVFGIAGKRYEFTLHTEVREVTRGPAKVVEMPGRSSIKH